MRFVSALLLLAAAVADLGSASRAPLSETRVPKCPKTNALTGNYFATWQRNYTAPLYSDLSFYFTAETTKAGFRLEAEAAAALPAFVKATHKKGSKAILTIGGWDGSLYFSKLVATAASRKKFALAIAAYLTKHQLDGVDLDWGRSLVVLWARLTTHTEYPNDLGIGCNKRSKMDTTNYLAFLAQLRKAVGSKLLTAAVPILGFTGPDGAPLADASAFAQYFDFLIIMVHSAAILACGS
jgi:chitinase